MIGIRKTDPCPYFLRTWFYINFYKTLFVFYLRTSDEYLTSYIHYTRIRFNGSLKTDLKKRILIQISLNIHLTFLSRNQKILLDIINTDKTCFIKINVESSPQEIWIRIRFMKKNGSPSLLKLSNQSLLSIHTKKGQVVGAYYLSIYLHVLSKFTRSYSKL